MNCEVRTPDLRPRKGLGKDFVTEVDSAVERIKANPNQCEVVHREIRHTVLRRFPYGVFYRTRNAKISVFAVVHLKRDYTTWKV
ncbi:MAG: type II toxin-antitoxin system RelE/ParE family toxin [Acidobacteria bacterium]|nr:type II toxin-antitoxin system RelE/ParE family toxin [Acidobacteriota bacterium]